MTTAVIIAIGRDYSNAPESLGLWELESGVCRSPQTDETFRILSRPTNRRWLILHCFNILDELNGFNSGLSELASSAVPATSDLMCTAFDHCFGILATGCPIADRL
ncbi:Hypothetical protein NTJ_09832 [Nesidiocoris tenuis]|uniref:Uncharacterized protein n=1 Tax=Nesidiocoris tenuis TaxID=355587 RepID=A0ABN7B0B2_9HEMI|nr:Hypothetical protein NTJ_09832 [Nesidiocoris tenuis]